MIGLMIVPLKLKVVAIDGELDVVHRDNFCNDVVPTYVGRHVRPRNDL
uniref:Uncharacterized protein n=1 Tax=Seriola lalandi dorsalis TaxID=1841481 RepID=A0A3B4WY85_SERLL